MLLLNAGTYTAAVARLAKPLVARRILRGYRRFSPATFRLESAVHLRWTGSSSLAEDGKRMDSFQRMMTQKSLPFLDTTSDWDRTYLTLREP